MILMSLKLMIGSMVVGLGLAAYLYMYDDVLLEYVDTVRDFATEIRFGFDDFTLGQYYFNHGDQADGTYDRVKAQHYYEQAIATDPAQHVLLWHQLGRIHFLEGRFPEAIAAFEEQIAHHGDALPNVHYMLALTYGYQARDTDEQLAWQKAEEHFLTYLTYDQLSPWARVDLAWIYFAQGKYEEMRELLEIGLTYRADNPWLLNMYGLALLNTGEPAKAEQYFTWALREAETLTVEEWGRSYPGNDPAIWGRG